ncbi:MAG: ferrochelatase [Alphaproteobacteria bacterium]
MTRRAVVLMNLGGPDSPEAVRPFLYNLFSDPAIIRLPAPLRLPLAALIASRRAPAARRIYAQLGGASPLLANTQAQARALEGELGNREPGVAHRCFVAMRYWRPPTPVTVSEAKTWSPDEIVLLPLYPQFSTTTTQSSLAAWSREARRQRLDVPTRSIRSYPAASGFTAALAALTRDALDAAEIEAAQADPRPVRLLLSAHGLPEKIVKAGDPYPREVATTAAALLRALDWPGIDSVVCYQSRVGPLAWIGPSVEEELRRAARDRVGVVVVPISFVSEHSETLVELDRDYRRFAERIGVPFYRRVPTVGADPRFIAALADLVRGVSADPGAARATAA